jgi:hypothetical protein
MSPLVDGITRALSRQRRMIAESRPTQAGRLRWVKALAAKLHRPRWGKDVLELDAVWIG